MKKKFFSLTFVISLAGTLVFGVFWLNNLVSAWRYHVLLASGRTGAAVHGLFPALDWSAIDISTVTTFIPFFGFLLILAGLFRVRASEEWPFFPGYDRLNIALGLIGTVWGIILVGYFPADQMTIPALMSCLHTAMFSTLAAIAWVMVLLPLVFHPLLNAARREILGSAAEEQDPEELLARLTGGIASAGKELETLSGSSKQFREELGKIADVLKAGREAESGWRTQALESIRSFTAAAVEMKQRLEDLRSENSRLEKEKKSVETELAACKDESASLRNENSCLEKEKKSVETELAACRAELEEFSRKLESVKAALR